MPQTADVIAFDPFVRSRQICHLAPVEIHLSIRNQLAVAQYRAAILNMLRLRPLVGWNPALERITNGDV